MKNLTLILMLFSSTCFAQEIKSEELKAIELTVTRCDEMNNVKLVPHRSHNWYIKERIVDLQKHGDTLLFEVIGLAQCCAKFDFQLDITNDSTLNINYKDISEEKCFCGNCPFLIKGMLITKGKNVNSIFLNQNKLIQTSYIYGDNTVRFIEKDSITGNTIIKTYYDQGIRYFTKNELLMEKIYLKSSDTIITKIYSHGVELKSIEESKSKD